MVKKGKAPICAGNFDMKETGIKRNLLRDSL